MEKKGPCIEKTCSRCCNPIKVRIGCSIPKDEIGNELWEALHEIRIDEEHPDTVRLEAYTCKLLDQTTGLCKEYEKRPDICRNTSCIQNISSSEEIEKQYTTTTNTKFLKYKKTSGKE